VAGGGWRVACGVWRVVCLLVDCGITAVADPTKKSGQRLLGDVAYDECRDVASAITPVPGGVGSVMFLPLAVFHPSSALPYCLTGSLTFSLCPLQRTAMWN
jgi:hypothetical protein